MAPTKRLNQLYVGMPRAEAIQVMGDPVSVSARDGIERLIYKLAKPGEWVVPDGKESQYIVQIENGMVTAFGSASEIQ